MRGFFAYDHSMANTVFTSAKSGWLAGEIDLDTAVIKVALVRGYTPNAAHVFVSDVTSAGGTFNGSGVALASKTITNGVFDAADTDLATTASAVNHGILIYQASAVTGGSDVSASAQRLVGWLDTGTGLPVQPGTGTTTVTWSSGSDKILSLS